MAFDPRTGGGPTFIAPRPPGLGAPGRYAGGGGGGGRGYADSLSDVLRKRLLAGGLPALPGDVPVTQPEQPPSGRGQPQIEYPIPPPPPVDREAQLRHAMNPGQINPYRGIPGFEHYTQPDLNVPGDALSKFYRRKLLAEGYPTRDRVQQISDALGKLQGFSYPSRNYGGQGLDVGADSDRIRRLLEQRAAGGGY